MKVAGEFGPSAVIKPLIEMRVVGKVEAHIADAVKKGAKIVLSTRWAARSASRPVSVDATNVGLLAALLPF